MRSHKFVRSSTHKVTFLRHNEKTSANLTDNLDNFSSKHHLFQESLTSSATCAGNRLSYFVPIVLETLEAQLATNSIA